MRESERHRKIVDYIKRNVSKGYTTESLKWALIGQGYTRNAIDAAFETAHKEIAETAPQVESLPEPKVEMVEQPVEKVSFWKRWFG